MTLLDNEREIRKEIFKYFGYVEDWRILPFDDCRGLFWKLYSSNVAYASTEFDLANESGEMWLDEIYTNRHLPKHVYRGEDFTMILTDPHCDGNQFLSIFTNVLEVR